MSFFELRQGGAALSDTSVAAALLCRSLLWGNDETARQKGPDPNREFKPGKLNFVERYVKPGTRDIRVVFVIGGDPADLRYRRFLFHTGQLWIPGKEYRETQRRLLDEIGKARRENPYDPDKIGGRSKNAK